jgi:hypothetical protein
MLCMSLIPADPPRSIQKAIMRTGATTDGMCKAGPGAQEASVRTMSALPLAE